MDSECNTFSWAHYLFQLRIMITTKNNISEFACFGGKPLFPANRLTALSATGILELEDSIAGIYDCRIMTNDGPLNKKMEKALAEYHKVEYCVSFCSGSMATMLLLAALKKGDNNEVIIPQWAYPSLTSLVELAGCTPVVVQCEHASLKLCPEGIGQVISANTCAILAINYSHETVDIERLEELSDAFNVPVVCDSVQAFGAVHNGKIMGSNGVAEVFSLSANKAFGAAQGGYVTTNRESLAVKLKSLRNFGFDGVSRTSHLLGLNAKLNEFHAALGLVKLNEFRAARIGVGNLTYLCGALGNGLPPEMLHCRYSAFSETIQQVTLFLGENWPLTPKQTLRILESENLPIKRLELTNMKNHQPPDNQFGEFPIGYLNLSAIQSPQELEQVFSVFRVLNDNAHQIAKTLEIQ